MRGELMDPGKPFTVALIIKNSMRSNRVFD